MGTVILAAMLSLLKVLHFTCTDVVRIFVYHMPGALRCPGTGITDDCKPLVRCWGLKPGLLKEQVGLITTEPSLKPCCLLLCFVIGCVSETLPCRIFFLRFLEFTAGIPNQRRLSDLYSLYSRLFNLHALLVFSIPLCRSPIIHKQFFKLL